MRFVVTYLAFVSIIDLPCSAGYGEGRNRRDVDYDTRSVRTLRTRFAFYTDQFVFTSCARVIAGDRSSPPARTRALATSVRPDDRSLDPRHAPQSIPLGRRDGGDLGFCGIRVGEDARCRDTSSVGGSGTYQRGPRPLWLREVVRERRTVGGREREGRGCGGSESIEGLCCAGEGDHCKEVETDGRVVLAGTRRYSLILSLLNQNQTVLLIRLCRV